MDSHDTIRILNRCNMDKKRARQSLVLLFSMPGSVCIYYGTEILLEGGYDPDNRRCMPWKEIDSGVFETDLDFTKRLIELRKTEKALISDRMDFIYDEKFVPEKRALHFLKKFGDEEIDVFMNCGNEEITLEVTGKVLLENFFEGGKLKKGGFVISKRN